MNAAALAEPPADEAKLVPIHPADLMRYVSVVVPLLEPAIQRGGDMSATDMFREVIAGNLQLWVIQKGGQTMGACVTRLGVRPMRKVATVLYVGGVNMPDWLHLLEQIEGWAKAVGATRMEVVGRKGWKRVLTGYRADNVVLTKDLTADV